MNLDHRQVLLAMTASRSCRRFVGQQSSASARHSLCGMRTSSRADSTCRSTPQRRPATNCPLGRVSWIQVFAAFDHCVESKCSAIIASRPPSQPFSAWTNAWRRNRPGRQRFCSVRCRDQRHAGVDFACSNPRCPAAFSSGPGRNTPCRFECRIRNSINNAMVETRHI